MTTMNIFDLFISRYDVNSIFHSTKFLCCKNLRQFRTLINIVDVLS